MKTLSDYVLMAKQRLGDVHMTDRQLGEMLGGYHTSIISNARYGKMSDPLAIKIANVLGIEGGELIWAARTARETDPVVRGYLEKWAQQVGKALASTPARTVRAIVGASVTLGLMFSPQHDAMAFGGAGRFRRGAKA